MTTVNCFVTASLAAALLQPPAAAGELQAPAAPRALQTPDPNAPRATNRTVYTQKTELFIPFRPPLIVGQSVRVGAHLSKLGERFSPYADAKVTVTITVAGEVTTTSVEKPDRPGVFRLTLDPTKAGMGTLAVEISGPDGCRGWRRRRARGRNRSGFRWRWARDRAGTSCGLGQLS